MKQQTHHIIKRIITVPVLTRTQEVDSTYWNISQKWKKFIQIAGHKTSNTMFRQWSLGWAWSSSETQLTRQIFLPWNRWWYRCHDDAVMMISWYHNMALAWSDDERYSLPRSKDRNRGTSSNTTSVTMCLIQVTVKYLIPFYDFIYTK